MNKTIFTLALFAVMIFTLNQLADNEAFATGTTEKNTAYLEFDRTTEDIKLMWDFGDQGLPRMACNLMIDFWTDGNYRMLGFDTSTFDEKNNPRIYPYEPFTETIIPCQGQITFNPMDVYEQDPSIINDPKYPDKMQTLTLKINFFSTWYSLDKDGIVTPEIHRDYKFRVINELERGFDNTKDFYCSNSSEYTKYWKASFVTMTLNNLTNQPGEESFKWDCSRDSNYKKQPNGNTSGSGGIGNYPIVTLGDQINHNVCVLYLDNYQTCNNLTVIIPTANQLINSNPTTEPKKDQSGDDCNDCEAPTLRATKDFKIVVDNGFSFNGNPTQVKQWYTPYPQINATIGEINKLEIKFYENNGLANMHMIQVGLGVPELGSPLNDVEVLIEIPLLTNGTLRGITIDEIILKDKNNLIESVNGTVYAIDCQESKPTQICGKLDLEYSYREAPLHQMVVIQVSDKKNNAQSFYFNEGINVLGQSMNPPDTIQTHGKLFTQIDKINQIWIDKEGIEYQKNSFNSMKRITPHEPYTCNDPPLDEIMNGGTRSNCNFRAQLSMWNQ